MTTETFEIDPERCSQEIYENGRFLATVSFDKKGTEWLCQRLREETEQRIDWHFAAGAAVIKVHPDDDFALVQLAYTIGVNVLAHGIPVLPSEKAKKLGLDSSSKNGLGQIPPDE